MWVVNLHSNDMNGKKFKEICGCDTEAAAHAAGKAAAAYYNGYPDWFDSIVDVNWEIHPTYSYSVKEHKGEWKAKYVIYTKGEDYDMYFTGTDWGPGYFNHIESAYEFDTYNEALAAKGWLEKVLVVYEEHFIKEIY